MAKKRKSEGTHEAAAPTYTRFGDVFDGVDFPKMAREFHEICEKRRALEAEYKDKMSEIEAYLILCDNEHEDPKLRIKRIRAEEIILTRVESRSPSRIVASKLLEQGVESDAIKAATVEGNEFSFVTAKLDEYWDDGIPF